MNIIYIGPLWVGATCRLRMEALIALGHKVTPVDTQPGFVRQKVSQPVWRILQRIFGPIDFAGVNGEMLQIVKDSGESIDVIWVDKGQTIKPKVLDKVKESAPSIVLAHYNPDDPFGRLKNGWGQFLAGASRYDVHFVPRRQNLQEYAALNCKRVYLFDRSYSPEAHCPVNVTQEDRLLYGGEVGFIGSYEKERALDILFLARNGVKVRVWGAYWDRAEWMVHENILLEKRPLHGADYAKAICCFDINLGFLRKDNRDSHNSRSIEIPACGGFMLAERSDDHMRLFVEGREAEFFGSREELLKKVKYYLSNPTPRAEIAAAGRARCVGSMYSTVDRMKQLLQLVEKCNKLDGMND